MQIANLTKNTVLATNAFVAKSFFTRLKGLLGRKQLPQNEALIIQPCNAIHTFFMRFSIDVVFLDKNDVVIKVIHALKPFRITATYFKASKVIELPSGVLQATSTTESDILQFRDTL
ncbi:MAG: DUF192 domain-containing protein [Candidatus Omnitrophica bacterium]|nr:DUF192 domain-containing protein [Candidatus Omnitrophota bacterium]